MSLQISCSQFDTRVQQLMDQRRDLSQDTILNAHTAECFDCFQVLASFQDLDDSFSGKLPVELSQALDQQLTETRGFNPMWPILFAITAILVISAITVISIRNSGNNASASSPPQDSAAVATLDPETNSDDITAVAPVQKQNAPISTKSSTQFSSNSLTYSQIEASFPRLSTYYRYSSELPGIRPLQESINAALNWIQNSFLYGNANEEDEDDLDVGSFFRLTSLYTPT